MYTIFVVSIIIIIIVLLLAVITTSKAYSFKHTVDPLDDNPYLNNENKEDDEKKL
ncbi:YtzI protein [Neobacillus niacini]|uniref:YtzI protein n=1 Tax=Neobacillus niacini TaxID=86668 RepID=UPI002FFE7D8D